jgi:hypothetical protein
MLKLTHLDAVVADWTVGTPWRPVELAGDAPLHANRDSVDLDVPVKRRPEIVVPIFVGVRCKKQN